MYYCSNVFRGKDIDKALHYIYVLLIPKVNSHVLVSEYRLISLCNVIYKIIAKTIPNRLKKVLPSIISYHHSAFIPRRLITDNAMVVYEVLQSMKARQKVELA